MNKCKLDSRESSVKVSAVPSFNVAQPLSPEFFGFVYKRETCMHSLHPKDLVVALLVIEHRRREVLECALWGQRSVRLSFASE